MRSKPEKTFTMFAKEIYTARRRKLLEEMKRQHQSGLLLFIGNDETGMNYADNPYPYRQDSTFLYFFGLDFPGLVALIDLEEETSMVFTKEPTIENIVWRGSLPVRERCEAAGIDKVGSSDDIRIIIKKAENKGRMVHFLPAYRAEHYVKIFRLAGLPSGVVDDMMSIPFVKAVVSLRSHKSPEEVVQIEDAVNISSDMNLAMVSMIHPGMSEVEVAALVTSIAIRKGNGLAFPLIATVDGQILNNHWYGNVMREGQMFLMNAGAENKMHYAGDISVTAPVGKHFTQQQRMMYDIALHAHTAAVGMMAPGVPFIDVHIRACEVIAEDLKSIGLMKGNIHEAVNEGAHALFFPNGLGHMLGLDVHDMEALGEAWVGYDGKPRSTKFGLKSLRLARELEPGYVLTVEPGVYFIPELIDDWKNSGKFKDFLNYDEIEKFRGAGGLRLERDYLILDNGNRRLGKYVPMTADEVEAMR